MTEKPGWKTTEFWLSLIAQAAPVLVILGVLDASEADALNTALADAVKATFALLASVGVIWKYIESRTRVKEASKK